MVVKTYDAFTRLSIMDAARWTNFMFEHFEGYGFKKDGLEMCLKTQ